MNVTNQFNKNLNKNNEIYNICYEVDNIENSLNQFFRQLNIIVSVNLNPLYFLIIVWFHSIMFLIWIN